MEKMRMILGGYAAIVKGKGGFRYYKLGENNTWWKIDRSQLEAFLGMYR